MVNLLMSWLFDAVAKAMNALVEYFSGILGFSFAMFNSTFPWALTAYEIFQRIALGLSFAIAAIHIVALFFPTDEQSKTSPIRIAFSLLLSVAFVFFGNYLLEGIIDVSKLAYGAITNQDPTSGFGLDFNFDVVGDAFADVNVLLQLTALLMIGISFLKLLLECVARYCILFMLIYASPLASSTLASPQTTGIFKRYFSMFLSQCLLVILNMWILKLAISGISNAHTSGNAFLSLLMVYSILRIGAKLDNYLNQLGLNAAVTGVGLAGEIAGAGMAMAAMAGKGFGRGGSADGANGGGGGGILGGFKKAGSAVQKYLPSPFTIGGTAARNLAGAAGSSLVSGAKASLGKIRANKERGTTLGHGLFKGAKSAAQSGSSQTWKKAIGEAQKKTADQNYWARKAIKGSDVPIENGARYGDIVDGLKTGTELPSELNADIANYASMADLSFDTAAQFSPNENGEYPAVSSATIGATMQGIGAGAADPELETAINVAYGNVEGVENAFATMDDNGIQGTYEKDGATHNYEIVNQAQYNSRSREEQHGFTGSFKSTDGHRYHYKLSSQENPSPTSNTMVVNNAVSNTTVTNNTIIVPPPNNSTGSK